LRFSDSELGGITIAWVHNDQKVLSVAPFTGKDLSTRSLADRINDIQHLHFLYPDVPKSKVFSKYYTPLPDSLGPSSGKGYVKPILRIHIPGLPESQQQQLYSSQPNTPQPNYYAPSPGDESTSSILSQHDDHCPSDPSLSEIVDSLETYAGLTLDDFDLNFTIEESFLPSFKMESNE
jgi:signal transducer and activator of transcription 5B